MAIQLKSGEMFEPSAADLMMWEQSYPTLDIPSQLRQMASWCYSNPSKRKTKRGIKRFINLWLSREQSSQERAARQSRNPGSTRATSIYEDLTDTSWA